MDRKIALLCVAYKFVMYSCSQLLLVIYCIFYGVWKVSIIQWKFSQNVSSRWQLQNFQLARLFYDELAERLGIKFQVYFWKLSTFCDIWPRFKPYGTFLINVWKTHHWVPPHEAAANIIETGRMTRTWLDISVCCIVQKLLGIDLYGLVEA